MYLRYLFFVKAVSGHVLNNTGSCLRFRLLGCLKGRLFSAGSQPVIGVEFDAVRNHGVLIVINDKIQSDPLYSILNIIDRVFDTSNFNKFIETA